MSFERGIYKQIGVFVLPVLVLIVVFLFFQRSNAEVKEQVIFIEKSFLEQYNLQTINAERQTNIDKVLKIISRYNRNMSDSLKYAIANEIYLMSQKYPNLNVDFIAATITHESAQTWNPTVTSKVGAMGLMQVMPATGAFLAVEEGVKWTSAASVLYDPILNIRLGCRYLNELVGLYEKDGGLAAYNGGPKRAEMWIAGNRNNNILWKETRDYVPAVLKLYEQFRSEGAL